jgi:hypothetical protein
VGEILELIGHLISLAARVLYVVIATPVILVWPRTDPSLSYSQTVWSRYKKVLRTAVS